MADELKPCPFCGGEAGIRIDTSHSTACLIGCATVGCFGHEQWEETEAEAITAWNRRTPDLIPRADTELAVERLARAVVALSALDRAAGEVARQGAVTGPQWTRLNVALLKSRATLKEIDNG